MGRLTIALAGLLLLLSLKSAIMVIPGLLFSSLALPWLLQRGLIFDRENTSYHNVRFSFRKYYREAYSTYLSAGFIAILSLGFAAPLAFYRHHQFAIERSRIGRVTFQFNSKDSTPFFNIYVAGGLLFIASVFVFAGALYFILDDSSGHVDQGQARKAVVICLPILIVGTVAMVSYIKAKTTLFLFKVTSLPAVGFKSDMELGTLFRLYLLAGFSFVLTFGIAFPLFRFKVIRYKMDHIKILAVPQVIEQMVKGAERTEGTASISLPSRFDIEIGY